MTTIELGKTLRDMYNGAYPTEKVTMILLFGVKYSKELDNVNVKDVVEEAGIPLSYSTEVLKAAKLSKYVKVK